MKQVIDTDQASKDFEIISKIKGVTPKQAKAFIVYIDTISNYNKANKYYYDKLHKIPTIGKETAKKIHEFLVGKKVNNRLPLPRIGEFLYRDADNYKFIFEAFIDDKMKVGDETTYEKLGFTRKDFHKRIVGYKYNPETDHNIVELIEIKP